MESAHGVPADSSQLFGVVREVRNRWRLKRGLHGAAIAVAASFLVLVAIAYALDSVNYSQGAVLVARLVAAAGVAALTAWFIIRPMLPRFGDEQVALYLEEHEPTLEGSLVTAVEVRNAAARGIAPRSAPLAERLMSSAHDRTRSIDRGRRVDARGLQRGWAILGSVVMLAGLATILGPASFRHGLRLLVTPWSTAEAAPLYSINVAPGNLKVARGGDVAITAHLNNFQSDQVEVLFRNQDSTSWDRVSMSADSTGTYKARLFDIRTKSEYLVESNGVRSPIYTIDVVNLPFVKNMDLMYHFPSYTGMEPQKDSSADIVAIKGTLVTLHVNTTMPTSGGRVVVEGGDTLKLVPRADGSFDATIRVTKNGFYKVELEGPNGELVTGSLDYNIEAINDRKPTVHFIKPGRDQKVMSVDEVYTEVKADDDYGVAKLNLVFSVNGGDEKSIPLTAATSKALKDIDAGYTFMLEDYKLSAGDVVSYYARATDNDAVSGPKSASTDIYFLNVRPFGMDYRQAPDTPPPAGGGGAPPPPNPGSLSARERDIVSATFKMTRDSVGTTKDELGKSIAVIRIAQQKLREDAADLAQQLVDRGVAATDTNFAKIAKLLPKAALAMDTAVKNLTASHPTDARGPESRALQGLQNAEAVFHDITVQMGGQPGGGGGGGAQTDPQDLADLFELKSEKMKNQYEQVQRGTQDQQQQQAQQQQAEVDSIAEAMKALASRTQAQNAREKAKADSLSAAASRGAKPPSGGGGGGGGGGAQSAEEMARLLERLARDKAAQDQSAQGQQQAQQLSQASQKMQQAADAQKHADATGNQQQKAADQQTAQKAIDDARRLMDEQKQSLANGDAQKAQQQMRSIAAAEQRIKSQENQLAQKPGDTTLRKSIADDKASQANQVGQLARSLDQMANQDQNTMPATAGQMRAAADSIRKANLEGQIRSSQQAAASGTQPKDLQDRERQIDAGVASAAKQIERMAQTAQATQSAQGQQTGNKAIDDTHAVAQGLQSISDRVQQMQQQQEQHRLSDSAAKQQGAGQNGQQQGQGQQGQGQQGQGQQGQGQQGQGQRGQGQQGQGQQGQGQQGQGQQGQGQQGQGQQGQGQQGQGQQGQGQQGQGQRGQGQQGQGQQGQGQQGQGQQGQGQQGQGQGQGQQQAQGQGRGGQGRPGGQPGGGQGGGPPVAGGQPGQGQGQQPGQGGQGEGPGSGLTPGQLGKELSQRMADAQKAIDDLKKQGLDPSEAEAALAAMKAAANLGSLADPRAVKLLSDAVDHIKEQEFQATRALGGDAKGGVRVGRTGDVPDEFKQQVPEYYRAIGVTPPDDKGAAAAPAKPPVKPPAPIKPPQ